jgi:dienelactone hydrolase
MCSKLKPILLACLVSTTSQADMIKSKVAYDIEGKTFEGYLIYDNATGKQPGLLMVPNWMGPNEQSLEKAERIAGTGYVVFMADMYGADVRPSNADEAGKAAGAVRSDRPLMRMRAQKGLEQLLAKATETQMDTNSIGAIGFCFGGGTVLELARSGAELDGVVSFHGYPSAFYTKI